MKSPQPATPQDDSDNVPTPDQQLRLKQLLAMSKRLCDAIEADIAALQEGNFDQLRTADPEIERLCALYGREVKALKTEGGVKRAPAELIAALKDSGARLKALLKQHEQLVGCMKQAAEGLVQAVAEEVEKSRERGAPYAATPKRPRSPGGAIVYNKVV